jgi:hypothetical protein
MQAPAIDRQHLTLVGIALVSVALAALSFRVLNAASAVKTRPIPATDLRSIGSYLAPLPAASSLAVSGNGTMVGESDPFGSTTPAVHPTAPKPATRGTRATKGTSQPWVVSSILIEASKRSAIINNAWVSVGDTLQGGARVSAIESRHVVLTDAQGTRQIVAIQGGRLED